MASTPICLTRTQVKIVIPQETAQQVCEADRVLAAQSGFAVKGKGGVPEAPELPLSSELLYFKGETVASPAPSAIETGIGKIHLARGIVKDKSGRVRLTAYSSDRAAERIPGDTSTCGRA